MYVAVKGGEAAIRNAHRLLADRRRGARDVPALGLDQITGQLSLAVDRVMAEGSLYDPELAAIAIRQARGDMIEAIFLLRAYRTTLPRFRAAEPIDTGQMRLERRVSATYKDLPGGQLLGPTFDYTHRLLDPAMAGDEPVAEPERRPAEPDQPAPRVTDILGHEGLIEPDGVEPPRAGPSPATSRAIRSIFRPGAISGFRHWRAATRAFFWRSAIPRSAATGARTRSSAKSASASWRSRWSFPNSAFPSRSAGRASPNARWSRSFPRPRARMRASRAATGWSSARASARPWR